MICEVCLMKLQSQGLRRGKGVGGEEQLLLRDYVCVPRTFVHPYSIPLTFLRKFGLSAGSVVYLLTREEEWLMSSCSQVLPASRKLTKILSLRNSSDRFPSFLKTESMLWYSSCRH